MVETKIKALEAHIATMQKTRAQGMSRAATWSKLQEELEHIVRKPDSDSEAPPVRTGHLVKRLETAKWTAEENAAWDGLRAEFEAVRSRIWAELDAYRSRKKL
jgi:hypothetical protein